MGKGNVKISYKDGIDVTIEEVFFVSYLFWNLLSMGQLIEKWHIINTCNGVCTVSDKNKKMIAKVQVTKNRMFPMFLQAEILFSLKATIEDNNWLWHPWFGHLNFHGLKLLVQKNMVTELPMIDIPNHACEGSLLGNYIGILF